MSDERADLERATEHLLSTLDGMARLSQWMRDAERADPGGIHDAERWATIRKIVLARIDELERQAAEARGSQAGGSHE